MPGGADSLYDRIGGEEGVQRLIDEFYERVTGDPDLQRFFARTPMDKLRAMQREFFGAALGGPIEYTGRPIAHVHQGRGIKLGHFQRFVAHLLDTLREHFPLTDEEIDRIISRINVYADEITGSAGGVDG